MGLCFEKMVEDIWMQNLHCLCTVQLHPMIE